MLSEWENIINLKIATDKPIENKVIGKPRCRWEDNIRIELKSINVRNLTDLSQNRDYWRALVNAALNLWIPIVHGVSCYNLSERIYSSGWDNLRYKTLVWTFLSIGHSVDTLKSPEINSSDNS